jgi:hypothetical protein
MVKATPPTGTVKHHGHILSDEGIAALMGESHGWNPQDGDELRGTVLGAKLGYSDISEKEYPIVFVLLDEGKEMFNPDGTAVDVIAVHCFQASLLSEMRSQRPERGDRIYIKRIGERGEPKRKGYNAPIVFVVSVTKPAGKSSSIWETFGPQQPSTVPAGQQSSFDDEPPF